MRPATISELETALRWAQQQTSREKVLEYASKYYGVRAHKVVVTQSQRYNDEGYSDELYIRVYGAKGREIGPDLTLPAWKGISRKDAMDYSDNIIEGARTYLNEAVLYNWDPIVPFPATEEYQGAEDIVLTYYVSDPNQGAPLTCFVHEPLKYPTSDN